MKKICFVVAAKITAAALLSDLLQAFRQHYEVHLVGNFEVNADTEFPGVIFHQVGIHRRISLFADVRSVWQFYRLCRRERFDAVHSLTPKAGLVCALGSRLAGIPVRSHTITGQVWATRTGLMRSLLRFMDRVIVWSDNHIFVDGESQRQYLISEGILTEQGSSVIANGGLCGVKMDRFSASPAVRQSVRAELGIRPQQFVFAFMGRLNVDKGIVELLSAFNQLVARYPDSYLLLIGGDEQQMSRRFSEFTNLHPGQNFCYYGVTTTPERILQAADAFVLPTYREGFPQSPLEAAALGLPVILSDIYGAKASILDGQTGLRCLPADVASLLQAMTWMYEHPSEAHAMGVKGRQFVAERHAQPILLQAWLQLYASLLGQ